MRKSFKEFFEENREKNMDLLYRMDALETVTENGPREARRVSFVCVRFLFENQN